MIKLDGKELAKIKEEILKEKINNIPRKLTLAVILLSNDDASLSYLKGRQKLCERMNVNLEVITFNEVTKENLINKIIELNNNPLIDGIMIDRPYPSHIKESEVIDYIDYRKDVDGVTIINQGRLASSLSCMVPPTAKSSFDLITHFTGPVEGKKALVIGRSSSVGRPLAQLLLNANATVTVAHSRTKDLKELAKENEILCVAIGRKEMINEEYLNESQILVDVGIHYNEAGKLVGDVKESSKEMVKYATPVPGGVGPLTNYELLENLIKSYEMRR
jgi:methylenetetrahydrofolate dehydrogenase (NADP+)/methenyltetrahydrofolate cyclohydrolase